MPDLPARQQTECPQARYHGDPFRYCACGWMEKSSDPAENRPPARKDRDADLRRSMPTMFDVESQSWEETAKSLMAEKLALQVKAEHYRDRIAAVEAYAHRCAVLRVEPTTRGLKKVLYPITDSSEERESFKDRGEG